jgi:hypothetical protein
MNWTDIPVAASTQILTPAPTVTAAQLLEAAQRFDARRDSFAAGKGSICREMAGKLRKYGSFASDKQAEFAAKLILWSQPRPSESVSFAAPVQTVPDLFAVMQKHSQFFLGDVTLSRRNGDSLCWIKHAKFEGVIGKIENGTVSLFAARMRSAGIDAAEIVALLDDIEVNPLAAAMKYGKLSGRCCSCGRDLTDPNSIAMGIGPVCAEKFG